MPSNKSLAVAVIDFAALRKLPYPSLVLRPGTYFLLYALEDIYVVQVPLMEQDHLVKQPPPENADTLIQQHYLRLNLLPVFAALNVYRTNHDFGL